MRIVPDKTTLSIRWTPEFLFLCSIWVVCLLLPFFSNLGEYLLSLGILWLLWRWDSGGDSLGIESLKLPLMAFFGWMALSSLTALDFMGAWRDYLFWLRHFLFFLIFIDRVRTPRHLAWLAFALVISHVWLGAGSLREYFEGAHRVSGGGDFWPTVLGCHLLLVIPWILCALYSVTNSNLRFVLGLVVLLLVFSLGATLTRSSLIGFSVTIILLLFYLLKQGTWRFSAILILLLLLLLSFPSLLPRLLTIETEMRENIEFSRLMFWEHSLRILNRGFYLLTGIGMGDSFHLLFRNNPAAQVDGMLYHLLHAHNFMIHYLIIWGTPGLLAYLWFLRAWCRNLLTGLRRNSHRLGRWIQWTAFSTLMGLWVAELFDVAIGSRNNMILYWGTLAAGIVGGRLTDSVETPEGLKGRFLPHRWVQSGLFLLALLGIVFVLTGIFSFLSGGMRVSLFGIEAQATNPMKYLLRAFLCALSYSILRHRHKDAG